MTYTQQVKLQVKSFWCQVVNMQVIYVTQPQALLVVARSVSVRISVRLCKFIAIDVGENLVIFVEYVFEVTTGKKEALRCTQY